MSRTHDIEERAALFVHRREDASWSTTDQENLDAWLAESDAHKVAYWRLEHGWREADRIGSVGAIPMPAAAAWHRSAWPKFVALAACVGLFVLTLTLVPIDFWRGATDAPVARFETGIGGHKVVALADESRVELNTDSIVRASIGKERAVWLDRGEAFFDVAHVEGRPFVVHAANRSIRVLGTQFAVRRNGANLTVAVLKGTVRVEEDPSSGSHRSVTIMPGDVAFASEAGLLVTSGGVQNVQDLLAWRSGRLLFDNATLGDAASQFNRYNRKKLIVDRRASDMHIGGTFDARNVDAFARLLREAYGLKVREDRDKISVSS